MSKHNGESLLLQMETRWHDIFEDLVSIHNKVKDSPIAGADKDARFISKQDHDRAMKLVAEFISMSTILIQWGDKLKKCEKVKWSKHFLASLTGHSVEEITDGLKNVSKNSKHVAKA